VGVFTNQVAVVTGAGSGVGRAIALGLAREGATLGLVGRTRERLEETASLVRGAGTAAQCYPADLALDEHLEEVCGSLQRDWESLDMVVHSAGMTALGRVEQAPVEELDRQYRVNTRAPYALTRSLLPLLRRRQGQVVFINSSAGLHARGGVGPYAATKHALRALADSLRDEVNADGVRVLSVFLGRTATPMQERVHRAEGRVYRPERLVQPDDIAAMVLCALRLPRTAEVTDLSIRPLAKPE
jgi:NADP-dependent 3-hydroxy acid dehydrogenase YdfG